MADDSLERLERMCATAPADLQSFLTRNRFALCDRWVLDRLERAPQPFRITQWRAEATAANERLSKP